MGQEGEPRCERDREDEHRSHATAHGSPARLDPEPQCHLLAGRVRERSEQIAQLLRSGGHRQEKRADDPVGAGIPDFVGELEQRIARMDSGVQLSREPCRCAPDRLWD